MNIIVTGSLAYDHIMVFRDKFKNHILPEKVHVLNVAFNVETLDRHFGGTAGNIAYSLTLLKEKPLIIGTVGKDFQDYKKRIRTWKCAVNGIKILPKKYTAQAFITTDLDDNQITAFHGGAMFDAHLQPLKKFVKKNDLVIISPNGIRAMVEHAETCRKIGAKFIFDPGQAIPAFDKTNLKKALTGAEILVCNDYEWSLICEKIDLGKNKNEIFQFVKTLIITYGEKGSVITTPEKTINIPVTKIKKVVDPTGCGDAYRAGILYGIKNNWSWEKSGQLASRLAAKVAEKNGTQNHSFKLK